MTLLAEILHPITALQAEILDFELFISKFCFESGAVLLRYYFSFMNKNRR